MFDVIGFGALNVDKIFLVDKIPKADQGCHVKREEIMAGGSAANTVYDLSVIGFKTGYVGKIGKDEEGKFLLEKFGEVDTEGIRRVKGKTGVAYILVTPEGERAIVVNPGVNDFISLKDIDINYLKCKYLHLTSFACSKSFLSFETQKNLVKKVKCKITFDPGDMYSSMGLEALMEIIERSYAVFPTKEEMEIMTSLNYKKAAEKLLNIGCSIVVVTMGKEGCYLKSEREEFKVKAKRIYVKDTTGAGDAFNAGFLSGLLKEKPLKECCELGNRIASLVIQDYGARIQNISMI
ncbi:MAG TPA: carbohydrate kinase family protein [Methanomicrobia archaeon]|nr:carbohydrate kinase family protein [Methanomicrobia archaeon]